MYFLNVIVFVVVIWVLVRQSSRISRIEKAINGNASVTTPKVQTTVLEQTQTGLAGKILEPGSQPVMASATPVAKSSVQTSAGKALTEEKTGRILGKIGVFALFLGVAFFLKYAFDNNWIGETGRVMLGLIGGIILLGLGQFLRKKYLQYSDLLMGGGIAVLYLSTFAAFGFYHLIPSSVAFLFMAVITALSMVMSIVNATQTLAAIGVFGGFLTPIFINSGADNMFTMFVYMTVLNIGILGISIFKKWQPLVYLGFLGTVINFGAWLAQFYREPRLWETFFFILITFIIFIWASIAHNIKSKVKATIGDYALLIANAGGFAWVSYLLLEPKYHAFLGFGAVILAVLYLVIANLANRANPEDKALNFFLSGTGVVFLTLAIPLQFDGSWITTAWLVEALLIYAVASMVQNRSFQVMGAIVYVVGIVRFFNFDAFTVRVLDFTPIFNKSFWLALLAIIVAYAIAYIYHRYGSTSVDLGKRGVMIFVLAANILTIFTLTQQVSMNYKKQIYNVNVKYQTELTSCQKLNTGFDEGYNKCNSNYGEQYEETRGLKNTSNTLISIFWAIYATILVILGFMKRWPSARNLGIALFAITAIKVFIDLWSLGELYRIISSVGFGLIALGASFLYAKYKDRLKQIV